jgi:sulfur-oxidizing protein SoxA
LARITQALNVPNNEEQPMTTHTARRRLRQATLPAALAAATGLLMSPAQAQDADPSVLAYRQALADKDGNPGLLIIDRGEKLFKTPAGPKAATLERCDFGLGPGVLKGAYAQLPRWFADTQRVQDLESRLVTCMVTLQGRDEKQVKTLPFANETKNQSNTEFEAITAYVAAQSDGMKLAMPMQHPKEIESVKVGEALFWRQHGPMDFSCATCHAVDGKRIRLQALFNGLNKKHVDNVMSSWPTYRVSHNAVRTMQHRMWDCHWQMRLPDIDLGSPAAVALISYLTHQANGATLDLPGMRR